MAKSTKMPADSIRGRIRRMLENHAHLLGNTILEVGSRIHNPAAWWVINRDLLPEDAAINWTGIDFQPGDGVDLVCNIETGDRLPRDHYTGIICSEVLEHVRHPWRAMETMAQLLQPGGHLLITTLTTFHIHGFPDDYFRYTTSGLRSLIEDAGLECVNCWNEGETILHLKNHTEQVRVKAAPLQVFAVARRGA